MAASLPPVYFALFWPYVVLYFLILRVVGKISWSQTLLALLTGVAYIFCWMNGVSSTSRIITHGADIFILVQRLHWVAMLGWAWSPWDRHQTEEWMLRVVRCGRLVVGIPLAYVSPAAGALLALALAPIACVI
jgi:hypothetical protein